MQKKLEQIAFKKILFCTDFSNSEDLAFIYAVGEVIKNPQAELYMLHIIPQTESQFWKTYIYDVEDVDNKAKRDIDAKIEELYLSRLPEEVKVNVEYRIGKEHEEIIDYAEKMQIDLIVLGRHSHSSLPDALFSKVTEKVVRKAHCAVMVIPNGNE